ncbi:PREDICTED: C-type lectin domain family 11 member A [Nanorana parkeri]|uniref:C-type lectin domain family 11 member A n=1 Tax=Nanorana parkeri TaxID=125878 RepID=UPI000853FEF6|nr:PREDICTED: C-type lectin domain family 11 member A [Nanorana parkeri]
MLRRSIFLMLLCLSELPSCRAGEKESEDGIADEESEMENRISAEEQSTDLENLRKFLLGHLEVTVPPEKPLMPPKSAAKLSFNVTLISIPKKEVKKEMDLQLEDSKEEKVEVQKNEMEETEEEQKELKDLTDEEGKEDLTDEEGKEDLREEEGKEDEVISKESTETEVARTTQAPTTVPADDNLSYILSRLSSIDSAIHRLNVQFYGLDVKVSQMYQSLSKMRNKLSEAEDVITTVSEMNLRNQRQIGQIEGCMKGKRYIRKCYLIFQHFEDYDTAQKLCYSRGGNLAMPIDQQEFAAVAQYVHDAFYPFNWPVWIGINDRRSDGLYLFENGHRVSYYNWYKDHLVTQPNGGILENCVSISSDDGKWWDNDCSRRMYYVCEY